MHLYHPRHLSLLQHASKHIPKSFRTIRTYIPSSPKQLRDTINIALIGPPGSGKGTYGSLLAQTLECPLVTMGDVLRQQVERNTAEGQVIDHCQKEGRLVPNNVVDRALFQHLSTLELNSEKEHEKGGVRKIGFLLDGYPRTVEQARSIDASNTSKKNDTSVWPKQFQISFGIQIDVPDDICLAKTLGRRYCPKCHTGFNVTDINIPEEGFIMPPKLPHPHPCPNCDMKKDWIKRKDDIEDVIVARLKEYHWKTAPVLEFLNERDDGLLRFVPYKGLEDMDILEQMVRDRIGGG